MRRLSSLGFAAEIAQSAVDVLVIEGAESVLKAAMEANSNLPIVVYANNYDPIERGYAKTWGPIASHRSVHRPHNAKPSA